MDFTEAIYIFYNEVHAILSFNMKIYIMMEIVMTIPEPILMQNIVKSMAASALDTM